MGKKAGRYDKVMNTPIRILCVFSTLDRGGAESMCMNLYRHIDRTKVQFDFVKHSHNKGAFEDEITNLGGKIFEAPRLKIHNYIQYKKWWVNHLRNHPEHQIVHGHFFTISSIYFKFCKQMKRITIGHCHSSKPEKNGIKSCIKSSLLSNVEKYSTYCMACSQKSGEWLFPHRKFKVLNNAIDTDVFKCSKEKREKARQIFGFHDELIIGHVGNFAPVKNHSFAVDVFEKIHQERPDAKLVLVGGGDSSEIQRKVLNLGLTDSVVFTGVRSDIADILQALDAFVFPSLNEGLPVTVVEAQAAGLKCFISNTVTKEVDLTGRCTFLPIDDVNLWTNAILSSDLTRADTSNAIIQAGYDIHTTAKWLERFYLKMQAEK